MFRITIKVVALLALAVFELAQGQSGQYRANSNAAPIVTAADPLYKISFKEGDAVAGIGAMPAIKMPSECTEDGTVFLTMVSPIPPGTPPDKIAPPTLLLVSVSRSGEAHSFPLNQVSDLYDVHQNDDYVSESNVIFLVSAADEDKQGKRTYTSTDGSQHEFTRNVAEHHHYIVLFDRQGNYQKKVQIADTLEPTRVGLFPSGSFLVYGYDKTDHAPKLAMMKDDGTLLKFLEIPKGNAPDSALGTKDGSGKGPAAYLAPVQFTGQGHFIYLVQNKTNFPLVEVNEAGVLRVVKPHLPEGVQVDMLIPSDENLYAYLGELREGSIYELNAQDGTVYQTISAWRRQIKGYCCLRT
jgi:hypothetical protein